MIVLTKAGMRKVFPHAPQGVIDAFVEKQGLLARVGILQNSLRATDCFANLAHECGGFTIRNLTENTNYTHARVAQVWPNRYPSTASVVSRFGTDPGWQLRMFDEIYGGRMGNRPGTRDGSRYIGRGGPQITGRDGYAEIGRRTGLALESNPELATRAENQPAIAAAFWDWKNLNLLSDEHRFESIVKRWNGGLNGLSDRRAWQARILPVVQAMERGELPDPKTPSVPAEVSVPTSSGTGTVAVGVQQGWSLEQIIIAVVIVAVVTTIGVMMFKAWRKKHDDNSGDSVSWLGDSLPPGRDYPLPEEPRDWTGSPLGDGAGQRDASVEQGLDGSGRGDRQP